MNKNVPAKVERYMKVMERLRDAKDTSNTSSGEWMMTSPWNRGEASELQSHIHKMIRVKRAELSELESAWCEFVEMTDDGCVEAYFEFAKAQMKMREWEIVEVNK